MTNGSPTRRLEIFVDGSSRGNPGQAGCGILIRDTEGTVFLEEGYSLGHMTNNVAEYTALIMALEEALILHADSVTVFSDSELMVRQMTGVYRVKNAGLRPLHARATRLARSLSEFVIEHVGREQNKVADRLAQNASKHGGNAVERKPL